MTTDWLQALADNYPCLRIGAAWGISSNGVKKAFLKKGIHLRGRGVWSKLVSEQMKARESASKAQNHGDKNDSVAPSGEISPNDMNN